MLITAALAVLGLVLALLNLGLAWVIGRDARARGASRDSAVIWAIGAFALAPLVLPVYAIFSRTRSRASPLNHHELLLLWAWSTVVVSLIVGALISPPDPFTMAGYVVAMIPPVALVCYWVIPQQNYRRVFVSRS